MQKLVDSPASTQKSPPDTCHGILTQVQDRLVRQLLPYVILVPTSYSSLSGL